MSYNPPPPPPPAQWGSPDPGYGGYPPPGPPPKKKSNTPIVLGIIGVAAVICLLCCGGFIVLQAASDDDKGKTSASGSPSPSTPPTTAAADSRELVQPAGAPYSYRVPAGFKTSPVPKSSGVGSSSQYETGLTPTGAPGRDILAVAVYTLKANSDSFSYEQLEAEINRLAKQIDQNATNGERTTIDGKRALKYLFDYGDAKSVNYFIFSGKTELQIRCQYVNEEAAIKRGCDDLTTSLQISD
jgi:hypothetical protein